MATSLYETTPSPVGIQLLAGIEGSEIKVGVMLTAAQGVLEAGSIVAEGATGAWELLATAPTETDRLGILGKTINTGEAGETEEQLADVYLTGLFNRDALVLGGGLELTAADEEILRGKGILLDCVIPSSGPVPTKN